LQHKCGNFPAENQQSTSKGWVRPAGVLFIATLYRVVVCNMMPTCGA
jgi:hypothetical protein